VGEIDSDTEGEDGAISRTSYIFFFLFMTTERETWNVFLHFLLASPCFHLIYNG
jgi:hypothetical protein